MYERLNPLGLILPPDLAPAWAVPAWNEDGVVLMFEYQVHAPSFKVRQQMLRLTSTLSYPDQAAQDMAQPLLATPQTTGRIRSETRSA